ncbi:splicing associated factor [Sugiyamaella lignohabitans]|uniref:Splicing associated factor n=1 Tax=Sugiyamaella lignohabitans TaxID=796027 RepID=A0A167D512_9ASCO|nr:splicing associated factor [Sugiyamaella lignohabitans]ANB12490.1 splicing associated factor [Sugiyamaella lignohabitans]
MKGDINPAQALRKKEKANQIKKAKAERASQRTERLGQRSTFSLERKIKELEEKKAAQGSLPSFEERKLESLRNDLADVERAKKKLGSEDSDQTSYRDNNRDHTNHNRERGSQTNYPGSKSIFWDPLLNPSGQPPKGYKYQPRPWFNPSEDDDSQQEPIDSDLLKIPFPPGPLPPIGVRPKSQTLHSTTSTATPSAAPAVQTTYESAPVLRDLVKESTLLVPSAVQKKRKLDPTPSTAYKVTLEDVEDE